MIFCRDEHGCQWHECGAYGSPCDGSSADDCLCHDHAEWEFKKSVVYEPLQFQVYEGDEANVAFKNAFDSSGVKKMEHHAEPCSQCLYELESEWFYRGWFAHKRG